MTTADYIKFAILVPLFFMSAPALGFVREGKPDWQRIAFGLMCFMSINGLMAPGNWGLTLGSIETYRGHTKGYHFYFNHAVAIALIVAKWAEEPRSFRLLPPGVLLYLGYCGVSLISITNSPQPNLSLMAAHKMIFATLLLIATFNYLRTDEDFQFFLRVMAGTMSWELFVVLKMKYLMGMYQVRGTFEHQNPLAMYCVLIGVVFLATGLGPRFRGANFVLWGFMATAVIVQCTLSRAALGAIAAGTLGVMGLSLMEKPTSRRMLATGLMGLVGGLGLLLTLDTIISRFNDKGNDASSELRHVMNAACKQMAADHLFGVGWNNYALVVNPPFPYAETYYEWIRGRGMKVDESKANAVVESHYYLLLAENGRPGLIAYLIMILVPLWRLMLGFFYFGHSFRRCLALGIGVGFTLNYGQSTLERVLVQPRNLMLWMILMGIAARLHVMRLEAKRAKKLAAQAAA